MRGFLTAFAFAILVASPCASAQQPAEAALDLFFKLGLPDSRGAKWVRAEVMGEDDELLLPRGDGEGMAGNAWLVRETNGVVELIINHTRLVRGRRLKDDAGPDEASKLPGVQITAAKLDADLLLLAKQMKPGANDRNRGVRVGGQYLSDEEAGPAFSAGSLLFLAHMHRQGHADFVREQLPKIAVNSSVLDLAVSLIADGRLAQLTAAWIAKRDDPAYAKALDALAAEFTRGWRNRDAVALLARRVRQQAPSPLAQDDAGTKAAAFLFGLKSDQMDELPTGGNWLLPGTPLNRNGNDFSNDEDAPAIREAAKKASPVAAFFADRRKAFGAVARLLDDRRLIPVRRSEVSGSSSYSHHSEMSRDELTRQAYAAMDRPAELREVAWALIEEIIPDKLKWEIDDHETGRATRVLAWFEAFAKGSDDEIAWRMMREASGTDSAFNNALGFLVAHGSADSRTKLRDVFLDPAVWSNGADGSVLTNLEAYAAKLGPEAADFGAKLRPIVAAAITSANAERSESYGNLDAETRKHLTSQSDGQLKRFDQVFKPQGLDDLLAELAAASKDESASIWQTVQAKLAKAPPAETEAKLLQAAPKAKDPSVRFSILSLLTQGGRGGRVSKSSAPAPLDAATRAAIATLLADETPLTEPAYSAPGAQSIADFAAVAVVMSRSDDSGAQWQGHFQKSPDFANAWMRTHAAALAAGKPAPPMPDATRAAGKAESIVKELAALPPEKILTAALVKTPDEQAALSEHLRKAPEWPPALLAARFTIAGTQPMRSEGPPPFDASRWKGRRLDDALRKEAQEAAEKAALEGKSLMIGFSPRGMLGGTLVVAMDQSRGGYGIVTKQKLESAKSPLLEGKPLPAAAASFAMNFEDEGHRSPPSLFNYLIWKDAALTAEWREKFARPGSAPKPKAGDEGDTRNPRRFSDLPGAINDPTPLDDALRDLFAGKNPGRNFGLWWMARPVVEKAAERNGIPGIPSITPDEDE